MVGGRPIGPGGWVRKRKEGQVPETTSPSRLRWMQGVLAEYEGPLTRYAARITGDAELARDVVQEVFLRLCREARVAHMAGPVERLPAAGAPPTERATR